MIPLPELSLEQQLAVLDQVVAEVARARRLAPEDAQDFAQSIHVRLLERDYEIFRRFTGRSSFKTYLRVVVNRLLLDWRNREYGKWRTSIAAQRLGGQAVLLERLMYRDGYTADQAIEIVRANPNAPPVRELEGLVALLLPRVRRRRVGDAALSTQMVPFEDPIETVELQTTMERLRHGLVAALGRLSPDERRLIHLRYQTGCSVQSIARMLHVDPKTLYSRLERVLRRLHRMLTISEAAGFSQNCSDGLQPAVQVRLKTDTTVP